MKNAENVKVPIQTLEILRKLKEDQGIPMAQAIRIAVDKVYGQKNSK